MKRTKSKAMNEFRFNYETGHMNYVFRRTGERYQAVGITHKKKTNGRKNMPLENNPQRGKTRKSYIRNGIINNSKYRFSRKADKRFSFSKRDFANVKSKIRNYKSRNRKRK